MQDSANEKNLPLAAETPRTGPTGPRTPAGKAISSLNGLDHGCCSKIAILPDEDPAEFEFIRNSWIKRYEPDEDTDWLVDEAVLAYWHYKRASKRLFELESDLPTEANRWTDDHHKRFSNFSRYKTTEERRFQRFYKQLEAYDNKIIRLGHARERAQDVIHDINAKWLNRKEEKMAEKLKIQQLVEVDIVDGKCVTNYYPRNEEIIKRVAVLPRPPLRMTRWIEFTKGVPPEYSWTHPNQLQEIQGDISIQKIYYEYWLNKIKEEEATGTGHIGPLINYPNRN